ncbi:unnamed protein product, partial [Symbiodinium necroappetens]
MEAWGDVFSQLASSCRIAVDLLTGNLSCCEANTVVEEEVTVGSSLKNSEDQNEEDTAECVGLGPNAFLCTPRKATDPTRMMLTPSTVCSDEEEAEAVTFKSQGAPGLSELPAELTRNVAGFLHVNGCVSLRAASRDESLKK